MYNNLEIDHAMSSRLKYGSRTNTLQWCHNEHGGVSNHQRIDCLLKRLFRRRSMKTSKLRVTALWEGNPSVTGEFPVQRASNAVNVSIWWRHHDLWCWHISFMLSERHRWISADIYRLNDVFPLMGVMNHTTLSPAVSPTFYVDLMPMVSLQP